MKDNITSGETGEQKGRKKIDGRGRDEDTIQGSYRDVLSDSHNHVQIVATAINSQILSFCNEKSRKREIATKSCGSEILATLRHVQSSISSLTPYSLFLHFTILLLI